jgi:three-Cys-motif partner protein
VRDVQYYSGREQTYVKHFLLERYLERVAWVIGYTYPEFVYVDGFSGPWESTAEKFKDTSFIIAINKLCQVRRELADANVNKHPKIRCLFVEKDAAAFAKLQQAIANVTEIEVKALHGEFAQLIPQINSFVGQAFSLTFIDPTGWKGIGLNAITPMLARERGEVLINFMYDYYNRFKNVASMEELMGGPIPNDLSEEGTLDLYRERLRKAGRFKHVTTTRILKRTAERSYFYLVYGTRHIRGLEEFRNVEKQAVAEQESVRFDAKLEEQLSRAPTPDMFGAPDETQRERSFANAQDKQRDKARRLILEELARRESVPFDDVYGSLLEMPLMWESAIKNVIKEMGKRGEIEVEGLGLRERTVKHERGHILRRKRR